MCMNCSYSSYMDSCWLVIVVELIQVSSSMQDTFDIRILMAKSVKHTVNFLEAKEDDLYRLVGVLTIQSHSLT